MTSRRKQKDATLQRYRRFAAFLGARDSSTLSKSACSSFLREHGYTLNDFQKIVRSATPVADLNRRAHPALPTPVPPRPSFADERRREEKEIADFYDSWAWKRLSYETRKRLGQRCQCCGATPERHGVRIVCDHIKPIRRFWGLRLEAENLQVLCDDCNRGKASHDETDWRGG